MEKITVYGLPLAPRSKLAELAGKSFCVSYATRKDLGSQLADAIRLVGHDQILLIDNGAFTNHKQGKSSFDADYLEGFAAWANDITARCPQAIVVLPDVIGGTVEQNADLAVECTMMLDAGERLMPIWHMHEPISYLLRLCESFDYVGFGSSGEFWQIGTDAWHSRVREAFAAIDKWELESDGAYVRPRIHMMRAQSMAHLYPFDSSDSTNVAMNHGRYRHTGDGHIARFAARVDGRIQASAGPEAEHQAKRRLGDLLTDDQLQTIMMRWVAANPERMAAIAAELEPELEQPIDDGLDIPEFLRRTPALAQQELSL